MPRVTLPDHVSQHEVITKGDITINLILTIKLDNNGLSVSTSEVLPDKKPKNPFHFDDSDTNLLVPDIKIEPLIGGFGEQV